MSSNQYGFTCEVPWKGRAYSVQVVYQGTGDDSEESRMRATENWETEDPIELARYELEHRGDWENPHAVVRVSVWGCYGGWLAGDPSEPTWSPPTPSEREILQALARGQVTDIEHGWDT